MRIELPFPSSKLAGHSSKHPWAMRKVIAEHREAAFLATPRRTLPAYGDIKATVHFHAPNNRGDRLNYVNRMKPYFDGIADKLGVNDKRFDVPTYINHPVEQPGRVIVEIEVNA